MSNDITYGVTLKADGSDLVGVVSQAEDELKKLGVTGKRTGQDMRAFGKGSAQAERSASKLSKTSRNLAKELFSLRNIVGGISIGVLANQFIDASSTAEQFQVRLRFLLGSVDEGNRLFDEMAVFAGRVPFELQDIMASSTQLAGVMKGGVDEIAQWMPLISDLAAVSGLGIQQSTEQVVRMLSAGAASADTFREKGILGMLGFQAGVSYSAEETRRILVESWLKTNSQFRGATEELAKTWDGLMSMMSDRWFAFRKNLLDGGIFDDLKSGLKSVIDVLPTLLSLTTQLAKILFVGGVLWAGMTAGTAITASLALAMKILAFDATAAMLAMAAGVSPVALLTASLTASASATMANVAAFGLLKTAGTALFAAWAGWEIGTWLRDQFLEARLAGLAFIRQMLVGWEHLKFGVQSVWAAIESGADLAMSNMRISLAELIEKGAAGLDAIGFDTKAEQALVFADSLRQAANQGAEPLAARIAQLNGELNANVGAIDNTIDGLVDYEIQMDQSGNTAQDMANKTNNLAGAIGNVATMSKEAQSLLDRLFPEDAKARQYFDDLEAIEQAYATGLIPTAEQYYDALTRLHLEYNDFGKDATKSMKSLAKETSQVMKDIEQASQKSLQSAEDAFVKFVRTGKLSIGDLIDTILDEFLRLQFRQQIAPALSGGLSSLFSAATTASTASLYGTTAGSQQSLQLYEQDLGIGGGLFSGVGDFFADLFHSGGIAGQATQFRQVNATDFSNAPRYHTGIGPGERAAVIREDEGVFTPGQMKALAPAGNNSGPTQLKVMIDNGTSRPIQATNADLQFDPQSMIVTIFLEDMANNGPMGLAVTGKAQQAMGML